MRFGKFLARAVHLQRAFAAACIAMLGLAASPAWAVSSPPTSKYSPTAVACTTTATVGVSTSCGQVTMTFGTGSNYDFEGPNGITTIPTVAAPFSLTSNTCTTKTVTADTQLTTVTCSFYVNFKPTSTGSFTGTVSTGTEKNGTVTLAVTGTAPAPAPSVSGVLMTYNGITVVCPPTMVGFSSVCTGTVGFDLGNYFGGVGQQQNCHDAGDCPTIITYNIIFSDPEFTMSSVGGYLPGNPSIPAVVCPLNLYNQDTGGSECNITVIFTPTSPGTKNATLTYVSNAQQTTEIGAVWPAPQGYPVTVFPGGTATVPITATALPLNCTETETPTCMRSDGVAVSGSLCGAPPATTLACTSCATVPQSLTGVSPTASLKLSATSVPCSAYAGYSGSCTTETLTAAGRYVFISGVKSSNSQFVIGSGTCQANTYLTVGQSCSVVVSFVPTAVGTPQSTITVTSTAPTVTYTANGTATVNPNPDPTKPGQH